MKSNDIHSSMIASRYRKEQDFIRGQAVKRCKEKNLAIETNAGLGNLTKLYKANFKKVITNDINCDSIATYNMDSLDFTEQIIGAQTKKIDLIDMDMYRCPTPEVKKLFEIGIQNHTPVVLCISDGLGLWMKRSSDVQKIIDRYLLDDFKDFDKRHPWRQHLQLWEHLLNRLCKENGMKMEVIEAMQTKGKNYVLGAYLLT